MSTKHSPAKEAFKPGWYLQFSRFRTEGQSDAALLSRTQEDFPDASYYDVYPLQNRAAAYQFVDSSRVPADLSKAQKLIPGTGKLFLLLTYEALADVAYAIEQNAKPPLPSDACACPACIAKKDLLAMLKVIAGGQDPAPKAVPTDETIPNAAAPAPGTADDLPPLSDG